VCGHSVVRCVRLPRDGAARPRLKRPSGTRPSLRPSPPPGDHPGTRLEARLAETGRDWPRSLRPTRKGRLSLPPPGAGQRALAALSEALSKARLRCRPAPLPAPAAPSLAAPSLAALAAACGAYVANTPPSLGLRKHTRHEDSGCAAELWRETQPDTAVHASPGGVRSATAAKVPRCQGATLLEPRRRTGGI